MCLLGPSRVWGQDSGIRPFLKKWTRRPINQSLLYDSTNNEEGKRDLVSNNCHWVHEVKVNLERGDLNRHKNEIEVQVVMIKEAETKACPCT